MGKKILIVDDDKQYLGLLKEILEKQDYIVLTAENAADGFNILKQNKIDLLITDRNLPYNDGVGFLENLKKNFPAINIIVNAAYISLEKKESLEEKYENVKVLLKPFSKNEFIRIVEEKILNI